VGLLSLNFHEAAAIEDFLLSSLAIHDSHQPPAWSATAALGIEKSNCLLHGKIEFVVEV
jgi:hypothetical protein